MAIDTLSPVTVSEVDVMETWRINGHGTPVVIDEPDRWWELARWEVPEGPWAFPRHRVVGEQFSSTSIQLSEVHRAQRAWQATLQVQAQTSPQLLPPVNVLYSYSDCLLVREAVYVRVPYGWVTARVANNHLVKAVGSEEEAGGG